MKFTKKIFHIYVECSSKSASSESWYFQILQRFLDNVVFKFHKNSTEFRKLAKKNEDVNQYFAAVLDVDIDYSHIEVSKKARVDFIQLFANSSPNIDIYLSSRCWENWLIGHFTTFNTFTTKDTLIPIPNYKKKTEWYSSNHKILINSLPKAVERSNKQRREEYKNNSISLDYNTLPDFRDRKLCLQIIEDCNPISYLDLFIEKIYLVNGTPLEIISYGANRSFSLKK